MKNSNQDHIKTAEQYILDAEAKLKKYESADSVRERGKIIAAVRVLMIGAKTELKLAKEKK